MGHIGLTPQAINAIGRVRVQGKNRDQARSLLADALAVQEAGAFAVVLELVPGQLAEAITAAAADPDDRDRGGRRVQRARSRSSTTPWAGATGRRSTPASTRTSGRRSSRRSSRTASDVEAGLLPGRGRDRADGPRGARRGAGPRRPRTVARRGRCSPGSRSTATSDLAAVSPGLIARMQVVRTRADAPRGPRRRPPPGRPRARRWAGSTPATSRSSSGRGPRARPSCVDLRQPAPVRAARRTSRSTRGTRRATSRRGGGGGGRHRVRADRRRGLPARASTPSCPSGRSPAPLEGAARPGPLRRRGDGGRDPVRAGRRGAGLLRAEGLPAGPGDHADGAGPRAADRGRAVRDGPRGGRAGDVVAQRAALAGGAGRGAGAAAGARRGRRRGPRRASAYGGGGPAGDARGARRGAAGDGGLRVGRGPGDARGARARSTGGRCSRSRR